MNIRLLVVTSILSSTLFAQEFRGVFSGNVTDGQGGAIAKARILATQTQTGAKSQTVSEESGQYTIPFLEPGDYEITVEVPGFKRFVRSGLTLSVGEHAVVDIRMELGQSNQSVTVRADAPLVESGTSSVGQTISNEEVEDLPLDGRTPMMLAQLAMGVISTNDSGGIVHPYDNDRAAAFSMGGASSGGNELLLNGAPDGTWDKRLAYSPPQDAVLEVRVQAFESDAAYGHTSGGTANQITKGGTNAFHGTLYDFTQVSRLDAVPFYNNAAGLSNPVTRYNQFGVTAGGPVLVPKVYDGRQRVFWFFAYEGIRNSAPVTEIVAVPTAAERQGDFSALLKLGSIYTIYDPATGVVSGKNASRTPFPGNIIPANRLNPVALNYLKYYPQPNQPGLADGENNFASNTPSIDSFDNQLGRIDVNVSNKDKLYYDFRHNYRENNNNRYFGLNNPGFGKLAFRTNWGTTLDNIYTVSPTVVVDVRANWTRFVEIKGSPGNGIDPSTLGFPSYIDANSGFPGLPAVNWDANFQALGMKANSTTPYDVFQLFGDVMKVHQNHTLKVGADIRDYRESAYVPGDSAGSYKFASSSWTNGPLNNSATAPIGQELAAFLLGLPKSGDMDINSPSTAGAKYYAFFVQDDWRIKSNLTLNFGLRWEHETPTTERFDRAVDGFDPSAANPVSALAGAAYAASPISQVAASQLRALGGLTFANSAEPNIYSSNSKIFSPRFGFAWSPRKLAANTVFRGGFGMFVAPTGIVNGDTLNQEGFSQRTQFVATNNNYVSPAASLSNPFPGGIMAPAGTTAGTGTYLGQQIIFFNPQVRSSYSLRWDFSVQRQLPGQVVLEVAFIGNHAVHLPIDTQLDFIPRQYLSTAPVRDTATINLLTSSAANPFKGLLPNSASLNGATVNLGQLLIPFPQYPVGSGTSGGIVEQSNGAGSSYFESLNVRLQKRMLNGLTLMSNFMWSSFLARTSYLNDSDPAPAKMVAPDSRPLREVLAATYQLPFGRNKRFDFHSRIGNALLGGWVLNGILTLQSGPPVTWGDVIYYGGPLHLNPHQPNGPAFDVKQFDTNPNDQLQYNVQTFDTQFNNLRRDPTKNLDVSLLKNFLFAERRYLQVRFESFNVTNHVIFDVPNTTPTSAAFGLITDQANTPRQIQMGARLVW